MRSRKETAIATLALGALLIIWAASAMPARADEARDFEHRYQSVTIKGRLAGPKRGMDVGGALIRFTPEPEGPAVEALTDDQGRFTVAGLGFGSYAVEIKTANGETIRGINTFPVGETGSAEISLKMSDRIVSETRLENTPDRFVAVIVKQPVKWKRFWREFGIYFGSAIAAGVLAL